MLEEERKYEVDQEFAVPELAGCVPDGGRVLDLAPVTLTATYYDTGDLRLARSGVSLRFRRGDERPWTVKLPADAPGTRHEISRSGKPGRPPVELVALVTAYSRGAPLAPAAVVRTVRLAYELRDADGGVLAELADDRVSVLDGDRVRWSFREVEVERKGGTAKLLDKVEARLRGAGAVAGGFTPKHVRALGEAAAGEPDLPPPAPLGDAPSAGDVVTQALRRDIARILAHDALVRLRAPVGDDDTAVHQMRVGLRRLRSDLRTFGTLLDKRWAKRLRGELSWLATALGAARDAEVLRERLRHTAAADPVAPLDGAAVAAIDAKLAERHEATLAALDEALADERYPALLESLVKAARVPRLTKAARAPARDVLPRLVAEPWRRLAFGADGVDGAADLDPGSPDERWHAVRIEGKRARYAVEAVAGVVGGRARKLGRRLAGVQELLGEHQDAATAAQAWHDIAAEDPALGVTAGRLIERERASIRGVRGAFPKTWRRAAKRRRVEWLP